jgi:biopolymer transport protein ExbD
MAMSSGSTGGAMADINVTPLVDVLLVLLIIFMITAPVATKKIKIDLPQPNPNVQNPDNPPEPIRLKIDQQGAFYWNDTPVDELGLKAQLAVISQQTDPAKQPELQINADDNVAYESVARVLADAKSYNLTKIGFTEGNN